MAVAALLAPTGCSIGADSEPQPATGAPKQIAATVDQLGAAIAKRDFAQVCDKLFTTAARERSGGADCAEEVTTAAQGLERPTIEIRGIDVRGNRAVVKVATTAEGQARLTDTLQLRREGTRWRIDAIG
jgi:Putative lumazine-binding